MKLLFPEEWQLVERLSQEWREAVLEIIEDLRRVFEGKGKERDKFSVIWQRMAFPEGILTIIDQKTERIQPLLAEFNAEHTPQKIDWLKLVEECIDVASYWLFMAAIAMMFHRREQHVDVLRTMYFKEDEQ